MVSCSAYCCKLKTSQLSLIKSSDFWKKLIIYQSWLGTIIMSSFPKLYYAIMICLTVHFCEEKSFGDRKKTGKRNNNSIIKLRMEMHQSFFIFWSSSSLLRKRFGTKTGKTTFVILLRKNERKRKKLSLEYLVDKIFDVSQCRYDTGLSTLPSNQCRWRYRVPNLQIFG